MAKGRKTGGRKKGSRNKSNSLHGAEKDLRAAWDKCAGPETARKLIKAAIEKALGYEVKEETFNKDGDLVKTKKWREFHFEPLAVILPYIAKKMPQAVGVDGEDGAQLIVNIVRAATSDAPPANP